MHSEYRPDTAAIKQFESNGLPGVDDDTHLSVSHDGKGPPATGVSIDQAVTTKVGTTLKAVEVSVRDLGLPEQINLNEISVLLHPKDPFSSPRASLVGVGIAGGFGITKMGSSDLGAEFVRGRVQRLMDEYHPDGDPVSVTYTSR